VATILIVDDSHAHRSAIVTALQEAKLFDRMLQAGDGFQGLRILLNERVDVVLCDLEMPGLDGEKLLRAKAQAAGGANIPFLFLTASGDWERKARLLDQGACDTVSKPFHAADLVARLRLHLKVKRLQDELRLKNETLARLSTIDPLTGLRNRRFVREALSVEFLRARRYAAPLCVLMADLDHFKQVNDTWGHPIGDRVLQGVASLLERSLRATDVAGRYGGEEFLVLLTQNEVEGARCFAERWRSAVAERPFEGADGGRFHTSLSIGCAQYEPGMESPEDLIARADAALYRAKASGRDRVET